jgi:hypothetical protein
MCICAFFSKLDELLPKLFEDVLAGTILLSIGFSFFLWQERIKASAAEVKVRCKELELFLEPFTRLNLQLIEFERRILRDFQCNYSNLIDMFLSKSLIECRLSINILKGTAIEKIDPNIPTSLAKTVSFQEPLVALVNSGMLISLQMGALLETMNIVNEQKPSPDIEMLKFSLAGYLERRNKYSKLLKSLDSLAHKAITGSFNWDEFEVQLSKIKRD